MIRYSINLPLKKRLHLHLVTRREVSGDIPLFPNLERIRNVKKGSKLSRFFKHIFEHKKIKKILGANLAAAIVATSTIPANSPLTTGEADVNVINQKVSVLTTQGGVSYPLDEVKITQGYKFYHPGIDFDGITGDPVRPIMAGVIDTVEYSKYAYGNAVLINHGNGLTSLYAHLSKINVKKEDSVTTSTIIGALGSTGRASGDHLHLEVRDNGIPFNPSTILPH